MTAKEFDLMVNGMRTQYHKVNSRADVTDSLYYLWKGLKSINREDLAKEIMDLYAEIDSIETDEIVKVGTFR